MKKKIEIIYTPEQFQEKGFDGEIAKFMRDNRDTAIIGDVVGVDRRVVRLK